MAKFGKWLGAGVGLFFGGPIGALIGFGLGSVADAIEVDENVLEKKATPGDFRLSLLVLVAAVMKADGKVMRSELDYVKHFFINNFGVGKTSEAMVLLRDLLKQKIPLQEVSIQIRRGLDYPSRLQLLHFLYGLGSADGSVNSKELSIINVIAGYLGISAADKASIQSMFVSNQHADYKILGVDADASDEEIMKAYRKMAVKYHPDKVGYLGNDVKKAAEEKFSNINEAYGRIKKMRGFS
jgi:DnaJ like chaperone protein